MKRSSLLVMAFLFAVAAFYFAYTTRTVAARGRTPSPVLPPQPGDADFDWETLGIG